MENKKFMDYYNNKLLVIIISLYLVTLIALFYCMKTKNTLGVKACVGVSIIIAIIIIFILLNRSDKEQ